MVVFHVIIKRVLWQAVNLIGIKAHLHKLGARLKLAVAHIVSVILVACARAKAELARRDDVILKHPLNARNFKVSADKAAGQLLVTL